MLKRFLVAALACVQLPAFAQTDDVLFSVNGKEVRVSEFKYIYDKNNGAKADYSEKSLREYLNLYVDFKLQVAKGLDMKLDENPDVKREQAQYRSQLSNNYLTDREVTEKLLREAYERNKEDRRVRHIFMALREGATPSEEQAVLTKINELKGKVNAANFADMAKQHSEDGYSKERGGDLGWFAVLQLPYAIENAVYGLAKGTVSDAVRSPYGYHLLLVDETRPAWGQVNVAHLLLREPNPNAKKLIDSLYTALQGGANFEDLVARFSEDNQSKVKAGLLGWVGINKYAQDFENAIFAMKRDGEISKPVQTSSGWHILKRVKAQTNPLLADVKSELTERIKRDGRFEIVQNALVARIQKESGYKEDTKIREELALAMRGDANFLTNQWTPAANFQTDERVFLSIGNQKLTVKDWVMAAQRMPIERINQSPRTPEAAFERIHRKQVAQFCLKYEETQLDKKYPEFKSLLREYEEGILLFEVKKQLIWDKASSDEAGLKAFFEANKNNYKWNTRARISRYTVRSTDEKVLKDVRKAAKKNAPEFMKENYNKDQALLKVETNSYEEGKDKKMEVMKWKKGSLSDNMSENGETVFLKVEETTPPTPKSLEEARGYVVADFQEKVEKDLLAELRKAYKVEINEATLKSLIKK